MTARNQPSLVQLQQENKQLQQALRRLQQEHITRKQIKEKEPVANNAQFQRRIQNNANRLQELESLVASQQEVIKDYRDRIREFEDNLKNIMRLDKDIHARLVNPQNSAALETNVKNVLLALNGKAPYDKLMKMIENIKV